MSHRFRVTQPYGLVSFLVGLILCCGCGDGGNGGPPGNGGNGDPVDPASWTVMVYMAADNNLGEDALRDLNEMEFVGSDEDLNIVVQIDLPETGGVPWTTARRYWVEQDGNANQIGSTLLADLGELDMSRPDNLTSFLQWAGATYPADRTLVVLWGHGEAWDDEEHDGAGLTAESRIQAIFNDYSSDPDAFMRNFDLGSALAAGGGPFDIVAFDACVMQILEVAYEIRGTASIMVASQEVVWEDGYPYEEILETLSAAPGTTPESLASSMVHAFGDYYDTISPPRREQCLSAVRLDRVAPVASAVESLAGSLRSLLPDPGTTATLAALRDGLEDFTALVSRYADLTSLAGRIQSDLGINTTALTSAVRTAVIDSYSGPSHPDASGLSLYYPRTQVHYDMDDSYTNYVPATGKGSPCTFINTYHWDEFLAELYTE